MATAQITPRVGMLPGPTPEMMIPMIYTITGASQGTLPILEIDFFANNSSAPFSCAIPHRNVIPSRVMNRLLPNPAIISFVLLPLRRPKTVAAQIARTPTLTFFDKAKCDYRDQNNDRKYSHLI